MISAIVDAVMVTSSALVCTWITKRWDENRKILAVTLASLIGVAAAKLTEYWREKSAEPDVKVQIINVPGRAKVQIKSTEHLESINIDVPISGQVLGLSDLNSVTDGRVSIKHVVGSNQPESRNNVEIVVEDLKAESAMEIGVSYRPSSIDFHLPDSDKFQVSYTWEFAGGHHAKKEWRSISSGALTTAPKVRVKSFTFSNYAKTQEEIKRDYEQGPKTTDFGM